LKELLFSITKDDFEISFFNGTGPGGQNRNKRKMCVRMKHRASGVTGVGQSERSLEQNKKAAFRAIVNNPKFKAWQKVECAKALMSKEERARLKQLLEQQVENDLQLHNLLIEGYNPHTDKWYKLMFETEDEE